MINVFQEEVAGCLVVLQRGTKAVSRSLKAGLQFPAGRVARFLKKGRYAERISIVTVLKYLAAERGMRRGTTRRIGLFRGTFSFAQH
ncbi:hypothetical protein Vadar_008290 [Vaccinium darrowii]|uniref:Uncharacterized protein n=1 Tax=Vaccinium darrowii TaxID=229202 RepID=A0ACB7XP91_9ERIC|nr:hypothetical protein Vadar_008290 [Vaccinium darrowii]